MLQQLNKQELSAVSLLRNAPEFVRFTDYLRLCLKQTDIELRSLEGVNLHRAQGEAQTLASLIDAIEKSHAVLNDVMKNERQKGTQSQARL